MYGVLALAANTIGNVMSLKMANLDAPMPTDIEIYDYQGGGYRLNLQCDPVLWDPHGWQALGCLSWERIEALIPIRRPVA
jgi:hypothetical protein